MYTSFSESVFLWLPPFFPEPGSDVPVGVGDTGGVAAELEEPELLFPAAVFTALFLASAVFLTSGVFLLSMASPGAAGSSVSAGSKPFVSVCMGGGIAFLEFQDFDRPFQCLVGVLIGNRVFTRHG